MVPATEGRGPRHTVPATEGGVQGILSLPLRERSLEYCAHHNGGMALWGAPCSLHCCYSTLVPRVSGSETRAWGWGPE